LERRVYLRMDGDVAEKFQRIKEQMGLKNDTEVLRMLINWYWKQHQDELQPPLEHFNLGEEGVRILDRTLADYRTRGRIVDVYFKPDRAWCEYCESSKCRHVKYALSLPEVREILRKKGWKIAEEEL